MVRAQALSLQVPGAHNLHAYRIDHRLGALPRDRLERGWRRKGQPLLHGSPDYPRRDGVLGLALQAGSEGQQLGLTPSAEADDVRHAEPALGEGAGLVEDDRVEVPRMLKRGPVPDEEPIARGDG